MKDGLFEKTDAMAKPFETELYSVTRISEKELAEFMGISVKTLQRLDDKGILPALRSSSGRRVYTSEHIAMALELMAASHKRKTKLSFCKNGITSMCGKVSIPRGWLEQIGISSDCPWAEIGFDGETIYIRKTEEEPND